MISIRNVCVCMLLMSVLLSGCTADLHSGNKFSGFAVPQDDKVPVYFVRRDDFMATKIPYVVVRAAKFDSDGMPAEKMEPLAFVGKDMFVPVLMSPGRYSFKSGLSELVTISPKEIKCLEVGAKFRGVTVYVVEPMPFDECSKVIANMDEGVPFQEAARRIGHK
jgi:hypothetical protein